MERTEIAALYQDADRAASYGEACRSWLETQEGELTEAPETASLLFTFREEITEQQHLAVTVRIPTAPAAGETFYQIQTWQTKASQTWEPDNSLNLM